MRIISFPFCVHLACRSLQAHLLRPREPDQLVPYVWLAHRVSSLLFFSMTVRLALAQPAPWTPFSSALRRGEGERAWYLGLGEEREEEAVVLVPSQRLAERGELEPEPEPE